MNGKPERMQMCGHFTGSYYFPSELAKKVTIRVQSSGFKVSEFWGLRVSGLRASGLGGV